MNLNELVKGMIEDKLSKLRKVEQDTQKLLAEINNISVGLPVDDQEARYTQLSERMRRFMKRLDDLSYKAESLSSELTTLKTIEFQMSV